MGTSVFMSLNDKKYPVFIYQTAQGRQFIAACMEDDKPEFLSVFSPMWIFEDDDDEGRGWALRDVDDSSSSSTDESPDEAAYKTAFSTFDPKNPDGEAADDDDDASERDELLDPIAEDFGFCLQDMFPNSNEMVVPYAKRDIVSWAAPDATFAKCYQHVVNQRLKFIIELEQDSTTLGAYIDLEDLPGASKPDDSDAVVEPTPAQTETPVDKKPDSTADLSPSMRKLFEPAEETSKRLRENGREYNYLWNTVRKNQKTK